MKRLIVKYLPDTEQNRNETYEKVKKKFNHQFISKQNKQHAKYLFNRMRQENKETITEYSIVAYIYILDTYRRNDNRRMTNDRRTKKGRRKEDTRRLL